MNSRFRIPYKTDSLQNKKERLRVRKIVFKSQNCIKYYESGLSDAIDM